MLKDALRIYPEERNLSRPNWAELGPRPRGEWPVAIPEPLRYGYGKASLLLIQIVR